ncbi:MAG: peptidoglycan DD-metalloendopeptidase family protein [Spirochaetaceae bacterium]|nr:peptidoglycan DD-metalloendopeptidase family protein [Spirochaetaceae bacterium]
MMSEVLHQKTSLRRRTSLPLSARRRPAAKRRPLATQNRASRGSFRGIRGGLLRIIRKLWGFAATVFAGIFTAFMSLAAARKFAAKAGWGLAAGVLALFCFFFVTGNIIPYIKNNSLALYLPEDTQAASMLNAYIEAPSPNEQAEEAVQVPAQETLPGTLAVRTHRVASGETISGIAAAAGLNLDTLVSVNRIQDVRKVPVGTQLKLPNQNGLLHTVKRGDSLSSIARAYAVTANAIADVNNLSSATIHPQQELFIPGAKMKQLELKKILGELFVYPTSGRLSSAFGMRPDPFTGVQRFHNGIDIAGRIGTPVVAAMAGKAAKIGVHPTYGKYIIVVHAGGYQTWYAHLNKVRIEQGKTVDQGQLIGDMGNTGYSSGPHLHFSIFKNESPVDPLKFLR